MRVAAVVAVIVIHLSCNLVTAVKDPRAPLWCYGNILESYARWCVPLFVMVSGRLLLGRRIPGALGAFYGRRLRRVGMPFLFWFFFYMAYGSWRLDRELPGAAELFERLWTLRGTFHLYFLPLILGLYAFTPAMGAFRKFRLRTQWTIALLALAVGSAVGAWGAWHGEAYNPITSIPYNIVTIGLPFIGYYLAGYASRVWEEGRRRVSGWPWVVFTAAGAATAFGTFFLASVFETGGRTFYFYSYLSPPVVVMSLAAYPLAVAVSERLAGHARMGKRLERLVPALARGTFGVYLLHPLVIDLFGLIGVRWDTVTPFVGVPLLVAAVFWGSYLVSAVFRRMPLLRYCI